MRINQRIAKLQSNLSAKERVISWMSQAHEFATFTDYATYCLTRPDEEYPSYRLARQASEAARKRLRGRPPEEIRQGVYQAKKDTIYLFFVHAHLNLKVEQDREALQYRWISLMEKRKRLMSQRQPGYRKRPAAQEPPGTNGSAPSPRARKKSPASVRLQRELERWPQELHEFLAHFLSYREAARVLSQRHFKGAELLFPDSVALFSDVLEASRKLRDIYLDAVTDDGASESEEEFYQWLSYPQSAGNEGESVPADRRGSASPKTVTNPAARAEAEELVTRLVLLAKAWTREALGEVPEANHMVDRPIAHLQL